MVRHLTFFRAHQLGLLAAQGEFERSDESPSHLVSSFDIDICIHLACTYITAIPSHLKGTSSLEETNVKVMSKMFALGVPGRRVVV